MSNVRGAITIAGTDPSGGAGIQADLKTFQELEAFGMSVITSVVAQNTTGVRGMEHMPLSIIDHQLAAVLEDMPVHALKTGMIATTDMMKLVASRIQQAGVPYVMDPVMIAQSGDALMDEASRSALRETLLPLATVVTPNVPEAEAITGELVETEADMRKVAKIIVHEFGSKSVVVKGGHMEGEALDLFYDGEDFHTLVTPRFDTKHTHGTGCTFSAAITAELAKGKSLLEAVQTGKRFIALAIEHTLGIGHGQGPTNHWAYRHHQHKLEEIR
ncbi:phosphomethylpyrimidine kinase [Pontibacillus halophilus JSM 076056 = DSM 19796]|uniref:Hydroxymethylpyrimidine/phosphomethylpyrimidine kinase n=1 Tax=Pontibacillus halophilus JSM 076056 = DSM 19796 TaxID=1385510 RepID=A0A0A5GPR7_9BACI|nr:bifunctional hydroxymethylpyrimidine kinase/phosphomethylpyrimidine kinase [Pontibacillus halophilus]KGX93964.1 phosphomethylpyrimidine kinase [Pontibacillus halophilus JSM 076056 = DSM 19796]